MIFEIPETAIRDLTVRQIDHLFTATDDDRALIERHFGQAIERCAYCFSKTPNKYYRRDGEPYFNPFHSVQYMTYLYFLGNTAYRAEGGSATCDKIYYLNKALNGIDLFYAVTMPDFFMAEHPVGTVIGRATIGEGFSVLQNCTVGGIERKDLPEVYPVLGENVCLYAGASVIGDCHIGDNVKIGAGTLVKNQDIPNDRLVFGQSPHLIVKPIK